MARIYNDEEKRTHLDQYRVSGKCKTEYVRGNDIPESTMYNITNVLFDFPFDSMEHIVKKQMEENNKKICNISNKNLNKT